MVCCDLMDDSKYLEHLTEGAISCTVTSPRCSLENSMRTLQSQRDRSLPFLRTFVSAGSRFFCSANSLEIRAQF